jgi:hypothetical protein
MVRHGVVHLHATALAVAEGREAPDGLLAEALLRGTYDQFDDRVEAWGYVANSSILLGHAFYGIIELHLASQQMQSVVTSTQPVSTPREAPESVRPPPEQRSLGRPRSPQAPPLTPDLVGAPSQGVRGSFYNHQSRDATSPDLEPRPDDAIISILNSRHPYTSRPSSRRLSSPELLRSPPLSYRTSTLQVDPNHSQATAPTWGGYGTPAALLQLLRRYPEL